MDTEGQEKTIPADTSFDSIMESAVRGLIPQIERLAVVLEQQNVARTLEALMHSAQMADTMLEGRLREDFLAMTRAKLEEIGMLGVGTAAEDDGPRNVFQDGKLVTPDGSEWDLG